MKEDKPLPIKNRGGAPGKFNAEFANKFCELIGRGVPQNYAAALCDVSVQAVINWRKKYPDFDASVHKALGHGINHRLQIIADNGASDWRCCAWWLERVFPQFFSRQRIEIEVGQLDHAFVIPRETLDQIAEARARLDKTNGQPLLPAKVATEAEDNNGTSSENEQVGF
jgi:hypothetical protein